MTTKIILIGIITLFAAQSFCQKKSIGYWKGTMTRDEAVMDVSFEFKMEDNRLAGYYYSPIQKASEIPLDGITFSNDSLTFQLMSEPVTYFVCKVTNYTITGVFIQEGFSTGNLSLNLSKSPRNNFAKVDTSFTSGANKIACRIFLPVAEGKFPAVVFLHGSGGEGMFANQYLAEYLASKGIVTLIQDKQGVGKSTGNWTTATFDDLAADYVNAVEFLKTFGRVNQKQIGVYGHSQGGTLAPLVASKSKDISFIIAAASVGDTIYKQDLYRVENNLKSNGFMHDETAEAMAYYKSWLDMARTGNGFEKLDALTEAAKDKKWFEWVEAPPKDHWIWKYYLGTGNYNSLIYWKTTKIPVLLVYGEKDQIEDVDKYVINIDKALIDQSGNKDVTLKVLPNAQHNLCIFPDKDEKFFWWHLSPGFEDIVTYWIQDRFKN
jgi:uncharacterized protein